MGHRGTCGQLAEQMSTYTVVTKAVGTEDRPQRLNECDTLHQALRSVVELTADSAGLAPVDAVNCLALRRIGAIQAWRCTRGGDGAAALVAIIEDPEWCGPHPQCESALP
jgi:hypothetical protein